MQQNNGKQTGNSEGRTIRFHILRYNPQLEGDKPRMQTFEVRENPGMTVFIALNQIRETMDSSLQFDFVCRAGICGSCAMVINGRPDLACRTLTTKFPDGEITLLPLPAFELIGDLSRSIPASSCAPISRAGRAAGSTTRPRREAPRSEGARRPHGSGSSPMRSTNWIAASSAAAASPPVARSSCARTSSAPVGFMNIARFKADRRKRQAQSTPTGTRSSGMTMVSSAACRLLGCEDTCPKDLPHQSQIAFLRRKMVTVK